MMYNYFNEALIAGDVGEKMAMETMQAIGYEIEDTSDNKEYFARDIDFIASNGNEIMNIEVKSDSKVSTTGNVVLETITNIGKNKKGWLFYSEASHVFFVDVVQKVIHCVRYNELMDLYRNNQKTLQRRITHQWECGKFYKEAEIVLMPVSLLETAEHYNKINVIEKEK